MKEKIISMIPARIGSERLKFKNLALLNKKPLIYYSINITKKTKLFDKIVINSDHKIFSKIAKRYKVNFYLRPKKIGLSNTKSDDVVYDFIKKNPKFEILVWVNPIAPLQESSDISKVIKFFYNKKLDSLITTEDKKVHAFFKNKPVNFEVKGKFKKTQDLIPINIFSYSIMMWRVKSFLKYYKKNGSAMMCGKFLNYSLDSQKSLIVKNEKDLNLIEKIIKNKKNKKNKKIIYDKIIKFIK